MQEYKIGTKVEWLWNDAGGRPITGEITDRLSDGRYRVRANGYGDYDYHPDQMAMNVRVLSQPDEPVPMFKASVLESAKGKQLTEDIILQACQRAMNPKSTDAPLELDQLQQYRDYLKKQMDAITGQHVEGLAGRLVATSAAGQLSAVQAMALEAAEIAKLNAKAGNPSWYQPPKFEVTTAPGGAAEFQRVTGHVVPDLRCPNVHERTGFRCRFDKNQRHSCETPAGFPIGRTMPGDAKPGEKRHCFGPVMLDLPAKGPQPKPPKVDPALTTSDRAGSPIFHKPEWDARGRVEKIAALATVDLDTLHDRLPRRWTKDAWRTR